MPRPSEDDLIASYFAPLAGAGGLGLRDDAARLALPNGHEMVLTKDVLIAGVHFFGDDPPAEIARKALRVNLSDLAAKGAEPLGFLLGLALPPDWTTDWLEAFAQGLGQDGAAFECPLLGGDTVKTPGPLSISVTAIGAVPAGKMVPRPGVEAGDRLYVSGTIGDAALGLRLRLDAQSGRSWIAGVSEITAAFLRQRYLLPEPRIGLRQALRTYARAAMDISDGLAGDLAKMLRLTGMTAEIAVENIPLSPAAKEVLAREPKLIETALTGGDDYEILCAVPSTACALFEAAAATAGIAVKSIGTAEAGDAPPRFNDEEGRALIFAQSSFQHF